MKTIFVHNATILDCAVLLYGAGPQGRSWHVDVFWSGNVGADGVLVDFGDAKRIAKAVIDSDFDHRLVVPSKSASALSAERCLVSCKWSKNVPGGAFVLDSFNDGLVLVADAVIEAMVAGDIQPMEALLGQAVLAASPSNVVDVKVKLRAAEECSSNYFSYTHSLKSHRGNCQRFHGHGNVIEVLRAGVLDEKLSAMAAQFLNGKYIIPLEYLCGSASDCNSAIVDSVKSMGYDVADHAFVKYRGSQGEISLAIPSLNLLCSPSESTIESIADFVKFKLFPEDDVTIVAYEGLQKGAWSS